MFYVVKELQSIFLSKDTLVDMRIIPTYFPLPSPRRSYGTLAELKGRVHRLTPLQKKNASQRRIPQDPRQTVVVLYGPWPQLLQSCHSQPLKKIDASWRHFLQIIIARQHLILATTSPYH